MRTEGRVKAGNDRTRTEGHTALTSRNGESRGRSSGMRKTVGTLLKRVSQVRILPGAQAQRPRTDHGPGPLTALFDGSRLSGDGQTALEQPVHVADRFPLGVVHDVRVHVHGDADLTVPKDLHDDPRRDTGSRQQRDATVPRVVQPDRPQPGIGRDTREGPVDPPRLDRADSAGGEDVGGRPVGPTALPFAPVPPIDQHGVCGQSETGGYRCKAGDGPCCLTHRPLY
jgi:hypothetical protein